MSPIFFSSQAEFRDWLQAHHQTAREISVGFYRLRTGKPSMTWSESVDQALCFGWIDSVRHTVDEESYQIRFTPRKKSSIWSAVNIAKVEKLTAQGLMQAAGLKIFAEREESKSKIYAFENAEMALAADFETQFKANQAAWDFFQRFAPSYRKTATHWIMSAKTYATQAKRLSQLVADCAQGINRWQQRKK